MPVLQWQADLRLQVPGCAAPRPRSAGVGLSAQQRVPRDSLLLQPPEEVVEVCLPLGLVFAALYLGVCSLAESSPTAPDLGQFQALCIVTVMSCTCSFVLPRRCSPAAAPGVRTLLASQHLNAHMPCCPPEPGTESSALGLIHAMACAAAACTMQRGSDSPLLVQVWLA